MHTLINGFLHYTGVNDTSGPWYGWWSGFAGGLAPNLGELAIFGVLWHRFNCHAAGCYRLGLHRVGGTPYVTCRKHHPELHGRASAAEIHRHYHRAKGTI